MSLSELEIRSLLEKYGCTRGNLDYVLSLEKQKGKDNANGTGKVTKNDSEKTRTKTRK